MGRKQFLGFTLVEILVALSIVSILTSVSLVGVSSAKKSSRDARRKADLEQIRNALEMYRNNVGKYPGYINPGYVCAPISTNYCAWSSSDGRYDVKRILQGSETCGVAGTVYMTNVPDDPLASGDFDKNYCTWGGATSLCQGRYYYQNINNNSYVLAANLETGSGTAYTVPPNCCCYIIGSTTYNYKVTNP